ncbi:hypothetical protein ACFOSC_01115 [Streptantibioticus rubrisoli]|uniref:Uncharacterized protein n=1 Tax=Streptantibioticus rubrisoli TaxID=1387313 RepID=A0ABT1PG46_9ACTN|nr:hypothetical protein [Streptantibioticus rubrisoli]MCQ4043275.1 hypothetical protein [Streptantibioticus rubrisoli]
MPLDGLAAAKGHAAVSGLAQDLNEATTPRFSWISPDNCSDAHDATGKVGNLSGDPNNHQGGVDEQQRGRRKHSPTASVLSRSPRTPSGSPLPSQTSTTCN